MPIISQGLVKVGPPRQKVIPGKRSHGGKHNLEAEDEAQEESQDDGRRMNKDKDSSSGRDHGDWLENEDEEDKDITPKPVCYD